VGTTVEASTATTAALRKRGGALYLWLDQAGMLHARTKRPGRPVTFEDIDGDGFTLHVDVQITPPKRWVIIRKRLPWPHFDALYDPAAWGSKLDAIMDGIRWPF
jgi:hypothetical protein